ncbi:hypothetical protein INR49_005121, partial [Caranx melampygus]
MKMTEDNGRETLSFHFFHIVLVCRLEMEPELMTSFAATRVNNISAIKVVDMATPPIDRSIDRNQSVVVKD